MAQAFVLYSTDIHKSRLSNTLVGVYTTRNKLILAIRKMVLDKDAEMQTFVALNDLKLFNIRELNQNVDFIFIEEITLNQTI